MQTSSITINSLYLSLRDRFKEAEVPMPELEARELVAHVCHVDRANTAGWQHRYVGEGTVERIAALADRLIAGEPLAYILGEWDFMGLTFTVNRHVLIPRSDTEPLCELAIDCANQIYRPRVLDLCAGTGCIGLSILHEVEDAAVVAVEVSPEALAVMRENARNLVLGERYMAVRGDVLIEPTTARFGQFHIIVCNPPYITAEEMAELDASVADYEPHLALYGGGDGLTFYRAVCKKWKSVLLPGGTIFFECGHLQGLQVAQIMRDHGFVDVYVKTDLAGVPRIVMGSVPYRAQELEDILRPI